MSAHQPARASTVVGCSPPHTAPALRRPTSGVHAPCRAVSVCEAASRPRPRATLWPGVTTRGIPTCDVGSAHPPATARRTRSRCTNLCPVPRHTAPAKPAPDALWAAGVWPNPNPAGWQSSGGGDGCPYLRRLPSAQPFCAESACRNSLDRRGVDRALCRRRRPVRARWRVDPVSICVAGAKESGLRHSPPPVRAANGLQTPTKGPRCARARGPQSWESKPALP